MTSSKVTSDAVMKIDGNLPHLRAELERHIKSSDGGVKRRYSARQSEVRIG